ncbi:helix-turn-helix domain-containing protein [Paenibacillus sp. FSL H7-0357]|uniref:helix-turn-helix domain-containing protein n=1 Tax=Paenibacillus sp. FSL H7-0357 TaxID=1536774 RepID=UPI00068D6C62|nr:helix-turn-helix domain-containing protein [Paenibacillus sp. FSL H7-0357]
MKKRVSLEELPPVLRAQDIADYLIMARNTVYDLYDMPIEFGGIPNMKIGNGRRTIKEDFILWLESKKKEQRDKQDRRYALIKGEKGVKKVG